MKPIIAVIAFAFSFQAAEAAADSDSDVEVTFDAQGRVATVDDMAFYYESSNASFASHMWTPENGWILIKPPNKYAILQCKMFSEKCIGSGTFVSSGPFAGAGIGFGYASPGEINYYSTGTIGFNAPGQASQGNIGDESGGRNPAYTNNNSSWYYQQQQATRNAFCAQQAASYGAACGFAGAALSGANRTVGATVGTTCAYGVALMTQSCLGGH